MRVCKSRRRAISEVVGTVLMASLTVIAGAAIFGYVNGQAGNASQAYGQSIGSSVQYLEEKFAVVDVNWPTTCPAGTSGCATIWVYNTGKIQFSILQIRFYDSAKTINVLYNYSSIGGSTYNRINDLAPTAGHCGLTATTGEESPMIYGSGSFAAATSYTATIEIGIPSTGPAGQTCPSYGQTISTTDTYYFAIVGLYGNSYTYSEMG